ncbi:MAG: arsenate reductase ArsC, partial [Spirochaetota bacterium]
IEHGLKNGYIDLAPTVHKKISKSLMNEINEIKNKIINDELIPPSTEEEYKNYLHSKGITETLTKIKKSILFLCTHNSARSQMAEGLMKEMFCDEYEVYSAGIVETKVNPYAIKVMSEIGIDISDQYSKITNEFIDKRFDYVVTVCDSAKEQCPIFTNTDRMMHHSFKDPASVEGSDEVKLAVFRKIRDEIKEWLKDTFQDK